MSDIGSYQVHSEAHGPHWVAWITRSGDARPYCSILLVAANQEEAEARGRQWAESSAARYSAYTSKPSTSTPG